MKVGRTTLGYSGSMSVSKSTTCQAAGTIAIASTTQGQGCGRRAGGVTSAIDLPAVSSFPRSAWECPSGRSASPPTAATRSVEDGIPTQSVGTRRETRTGVRFRMTDDRF